MLKKITPNVNPGDPMKSFPSSSRPQKAMQSKKLIFLFSAILISFLIYAVYDTTKLPQISWIHESVDINFMKDSVGIQTKHSLTSQSSLHNVNMRSVSCSSSCSGETPLFFLDSSKSSSRSKITASIHAIDFPALRECSKKNFQNLVLKCQFEFRIILFGIAATTYSIEKTLSATPEQSQGQEILSFVSSFINISTAFKEVHPNRINVQFGFNQNKPSQSLINKIPIGDPFDSTCDVEVHSIKVSTPSISQEVDLHYEGCDLSQGALEIPPVTLDLLNIASTFEVTLANRLELNQTKCIGTLYSLVYDAGHAMNTNNFNGTFPFSLQSRNQQRNVAEKAIDGIAIEAELATNFSNHMRCPHVHNGICDDGGPGSQTSLCYYGSDSDDCGGRGVGDQQLRGMEYALSVNQKRVIDGVAYFGENRPDSTRGPFVSHTKGALDSELYFTLDEDGMNGEVRRYGKEEIQITSRPLDHDMFTELGVLRRQGSSRSLMPVNDAVEAYFEDTRRLDHMAEHDSSYSGGSSSYSGGSSSYSGDSTTFNPDITADELCYNDKSMCDYLDDGACDDGGVGSEYDDCAYGYDCRDCGVRKAGGADMLGALAVTFKDVSNKEDSFDLTVYVRSDPHFIWDKLGEGSADFMLRREAGKQSGEGAWSLEISGAAKVENLDSDITSAR